MRWVHLPSARALLHSLLEQHEALSQNRYISRPNEYQSNPLDLVQVRRTPAHFPNEKFGYRLSQAEFNRLVELVGKDAVFNAENLGPGRRQAPPEFQIAVFLHRLAHGLSLEALSDLFSISSE